MISMRAIIILISSHLNSIIISHLNSIYYINIIMRVHFGFSLVENCAMMSSDDVCT